jgi:ABC-type sulfate/molybdate transport systems ATPase subunit
MKSIETNEKYLAYRGQAILCKRLADGCDSQMKTLNDLITMTQSEITKVFNEVSVMSEIDYAKVNSFDTVRQYAKSKFYALKCEYETLLSNCLNAEQSMKEMEQKFQHATAEKKQTKQKQREQIWGTSSSTDI